MPLHCTINNMSPLISGQYLTYISSYDMISLGEGCQHVYYSHSQKIGTGKNSDNLYNSYKLSNFIESIIFASIFIPYVFIIPLNLTLNI